MGSFIEIKPITWQEFIDTNPMSNLYDKKYIYRGQTNSSTNGKFSEWELVSSFNRNYTKRQYRFSNFMSQQVSFMDSKYSEYEFVKNSYILNSNIISKIYFLQHYGIPTCFVDFTFNPLTSLYFSISALKGQSGGEFIVEGFPTYYPDNYYFTVIRIETERLRKLLDIKKLQHFELDLFINYDSYCIDIDRNYYAQVALDLAPLESVNNSNNFNLLNQDSCFLLFDNASCSSFSFEKFLRFFIEKHQISINEPLITKYHIKYNTAFKPMRSRQPNYISLFKFLKQNNISGKTLFNDIQGLKYDFNFFHQE
jgi:hypothetical protein